MEFRREEILPAVYLTALRTDKFKTAVLSLSLLTQLDAETASMNALIPSVLRRGTVRCPDMDSLASYMDGLYGLRAEPVVRCVGEIQAPGFYLNFPDDRYLPGKERLLPKAAALLGELLLTPNTRGGLFLPDYVERERARLAERIRARRNNKDGYALLRLIELMCAYEPMSVGSLGKEQDAEGINYVALSKHYRRLVASAPMELFYCGTANFDEAASALTEALAQLPRGEIDEDMGTEIRMNSVEAGPRSYRESMELSQGKLAMGWRLGECMEEPDLAAIRVFNAVYGGSPASKLFMNVRERQLEAVKRGEITDEELDTAKRSVSSALRAVEDDPAMLEGYWLPMNVSGAQLSPAELAASCELVTREEAAAIAKSCEFDAELYLCGKEDGDEPAED